MDNRMSTGFKVKEKKAGKAILVPDFMGG